MISVKVISGPHIITPMYIVTAISSVPLGPLQTFESLHEFLQLATAWRLHSPVLRHSTVQSWNKWEHVAWIFKKDSSTLSPFPSQFSVSSSLLPNTHAVYRVSSANTAGSAGKGLIGLVCGQPHKGGNWHFNIWHVAFLHSAAVIEYTWNPPALVTPECATHLEIVRFN